MIVPSDIVPFGMKIKVEAADLEELKTEIKRQITTLNADENIEISEAVPIGTDPVPFKTLDEINKLEDKNIQIHKTDSSAQPAPTSQSVLEEQPSAAPTPSSRTAPRASTPRRAPCSQAGAEITLR